MSGKGSNGGKAAVISSKIGCTIVAQQPPNRGIVDAKQECAVESEVEHDAEICLVIVLGLIEQGGVDPVGFGAHGKPGMQAIVETNARLHRKRAAAAARSLGLQVRTAHETVCPRLKPVATGANTESTTAAEILHMFVDVDCGGETGDDVAFDGEPAVRVVADRGVGADESGVDNVRLEAINLDAQANLPAVIIAIAIDEIRFGSRRGGNRSGIGGGSSECEAARLAGAGLE